MIKARAAAEAAKRQADIYSKKASESTIRASVRSKNEKKCYIKKTKAEDIQVTNEIQLSAGRKATNMHRDIFCKHGTEKVKELYVAMDAYNALLPKDNQVVDAYKRSEADKVRDSSLKGCKLQFNKAKTTKSCGFSDKNDEYIPEL